MRNKFALLFTLAFLSVSLLSFSNPNCTDIVWYQFIGGKPDISYVHAAERVAKTWGFTMHYEFGSCGDTAKDQELANACFEKNKESLPCLEEKYGENWQDKFWEEVKIEQDKSTY